MSVRDIPVPAIVLDGDRVIVDVNPQAATLVGCEPGELMNTPITHALRPRKISGEDLLTDWHPSAYLRSTSRLNEQEVLIRRCDGSEMEVMVDGGYNRDDSGELTGATLLLRPRHHGRRRPRSGVRIVSAVSHELRSPLTSLRGYTSLLLKRWDTVEDDDRKQMLQQIDRDARRISRMISELLDIARLETGRLQLNRTQTDLCQVLTDVIHNVKMMYPEADIAVKVEPDFPQVWADADKINQVLTNLIENACKYASPKGIVVTMEATGNEVGVAVSDAGPGIPASDLPRLFQQFFRSSQGRPTGTGLGLWISRGLIESHQGQLTASSDETTGSTFRFTLPRNLFDTLHGRSDT